jgi:signal transduction histidine kinase
VQAFAAHGADERADRAGRLAAIFFGSGGILGLLTLPLLPTDAAVGTTAIVSVLALLAGVIAWHVPWGALPPRATLWLVIPAFVLIAAANAAGGSDYFSYPVFFFLVFVWLGLLHPPRTSLLVLPLAAAAYVIPLAFLPHQDRAAGATSALVVLPVCVLVGEALSRSIQWVATAETELQRERALGDRLRRIDQMRDTFMRAASHELRTPITVCRGHLEILGPEADAEELEATRALVIDELERMQRLVSDITMLSRLEDGAGLDVGPTAIERLMAAVGVKAEAIVGHSVATHVDGEGMVRVDRQRLEQALLGAVMNVRDHAGPGAKVELGAVRERHGWRFDVSDDGVGVPRSIEDELFHPFRHGAASEGSGLGLAIVSAIARAHGGEAFARPREPTGTTISVRIPT